MDGFFSFDGHNPIPTIEALDPFELDFDNAVNGEADADSAYGDLPEDPHPLLDTELLLSSEDEKYIPQVQTDIITGPRTKTVPRRSPSSQYASHQSSASFGNPVTPLDDRIAWKRASETVSVEIPNLSLLTPRSCYEPFELGAPELSERAAVAILLAAHKKLQGETANDDEFVEFQLDDFAVYWENVKRPMEMKSLNHLDTKQAHSEYFFNGILSLGETKAFVRRVPIAALPIGNYGDTDESTVRDSIWVQSRMNSSKEIYYRLAQPAKEYERFFYPFLWLADLAKHVVDFLHSVAEKKVTLYDFRSVFGVWIRGVHGENISRWLQQHPSHDFRTSIVANVAFLYKECVGVLGYERTHFHTIWAEIWDLCRYNRMPKSPSSRTVVTQYVYDFFHHMPFGDQLEPVSIGGEAERLREELIRKRHLELPSALQREPKEMSKASHERIHDIQPGDTISTHRDTEESGSRWKKEKPIGRADHDCWFALVQKVHIDARGRRKFDVIWYYQPSDTLCGLMQYPWKNEIFLSNHCSCGDRQKIAEDEILGVHNVDFGGYSTTTAEVFCRLTYIHEERKWITLKSDHKHCRHNKADTDSVSQYRVGDTVFVHIDPNDTFSEPCEITNLAYQGRAGLACSLRKLSRRGDVDLNAKGARPNELVYTNIFCEASDAQIVAMCYVRFFNHKDEIPTPYNRDGVGAFFYLTHAQISDGESYQYVPLDQAPPSLRQGFDPNRRVPKLRGLDLFCGGGNFGRGLEDTGAIEMLWANDFSLEAIHTYMANVADPEAVHPFFGSVDDLQRQAIEGNFVSNVPKIGDVDFISAGSPCPGFSNLTNDKTTVAQRKNQSLVASFGSFVDLYRPKFALLENVPGIVHRKTNRDQDVFSQLMCVLVGMGYQAQFFYLDATSCGAPQRRSRVFVVCAAPGYRLPAKPLPTHAHPPYTRRLAIGYLPNGQPMAERDMDTVTPFNFVTARAAVADLPSLYDAKPDVCVAFPDHRATHDITMTIRLRAQLIPIRPWGMNFAQAWYGLDRKSAGSGVLTPAERLVFPADSAYSMSKRGTAIGRTRANSNAYGRVHGSRPFETVVTFQSIEDAKTGRYLHWREPRPLTVMEGRRAQGFRDEEVLLGTPYVQWKIVGNSVARHVAVALAVVFREAWLGTLQEDEEGILQSAVRKEVLREVDGNDKMEETVNDGCATDAVMGMPHAGVDADDLVSKAVYNGDPTPSPANKKRSLADTLAERLASKLPRLAN